jgi:hypothetical protein
MSRLTQFALGSVVLAAVLTAIGQGVFGDSGEIGAWLIELAAILVAAAIVFGWAVRRYGGTETGSTAALVLAVLGAVSLAVFWLGLPSVLAGGAALLALDVRERGGRTGAATGALVLAGLTVLVAVLLAIFG